MLILFHFYLIDFCFSANLLPLLQTTCNGDRQVYNFSEYRCYDCPENFTRIQDVCRPENLSFINASSNQISYVQSCDDDQVQLGLVCFRSGAIESRVNYLKEEFKGKYFDVANQNNEYDQVTTEITDDFLEQYAYAELFHVADPFNQTAVALLSNACSVFNYDLSAYSCTQFNRYFSQITGNKYGYMFWPASGPFILYGDNAPLRYISEEDYVTKSYDLGDTIAFQLARFSKYGEFKGFTRLSVDFQMCSDSNENINNWQKFGYNYYRECLIDLDGLISSDSTDFFDPFIEDGTDNGRAILRPVPVISKNYRGVNGEATNRGSRESDYKAVRRFFLNDNYTSNEIVQHLKSFTVTFNLKKDDKHKIYPPFFTVEYAQVRRRDIANNDFYVTLEKETVSTPKFNFKVVYLRSINGFWQAAIIVFCLLIALGLVYYFIMILMFIRNYGIDGFRSSVLMGILGYLFDLLGTIVFVVAFAFSVYIFIFFKFQHSSFICLPEEKEFMLLIPVLLVALVLKLAGIIFLIILKSSSNTFIIDWENPKDEDIPISGWRRIMVANEWNRILTVRHYNIPFTVLSMAFIIGGFDLHLLATPIPSTKLIEMDKQYFILRFGFYSFVWLLLILFQFLMSRFVIWRIFGNPFLNFIDLCSTSNISILIQLSPFQGYYIHGKSPQYTTDVDHDKLASRLKSKDPPNRGLVEGSTDQVFEVFFTEEMRQQMTELYNSQLAQTGSPSVLKLRMQTAADFPQAAYEVNEKINGFLKEFFDGNSENQYVIQQKNYLQYILGMAPVSLENSVLMPVNELSYKFSLISGIEWKLQLFYLLIFSCISIPVSSPCIPAIVVFIVDLIIIKIFNLIGRSNLSKKILLDDRFFL